MDNQDKKESLTNNKSHKVIISCPKCKLKLRLPILEGKKLRVTCPNPKCKNEFSFEYTKYTKKQKLISLSTIIACVIVISTAIIAPIFLLEIRNVLINKIKNENESGLQKMQDEFAMESMGIKENYDNEIKKIDLVSLKTQAAEHYEKIWEERKSYSSKYAMTPREKAQLEMLTLSKDKTKGIEDIIRGIAMKAAPDNSTVNVFSSSSGFSLDIDFDMSEISSGERGTKTKHDSIDSLKKDVIRLVSKVTNDIFEYCRNLDLDSISIGCRHYVRQYDEMENYMGDVNETLYKICLKEIDLRELSDNPFLETYLTTEYFKVEIDEFSNLSIEIIESYTYEPITIPKKVLEPIPYKSTLPKEPIKLPEFKPREAIKP